MRMLAKYCGVERLTNPKVCLGSAVTHNCSIFVRKPFLLAFGAFQQYEFAWLLVNRPHHETAYFAARIHLPIPSRAGMLAFYKPQLRFENSNESACMLLALYLFSVALVWNKLPIEKEERL